MISYHIASSGRTGILYKDTEMRLYFLFNVWKTKA